MLYIVIQSAEASIPGSRPAPGQIMMLRPKGGHLHPFHSISAKEISRKRRGTSIICLDPFKRRNIKPRVIEPAIAQFAPQDKKPPADPLLVLKKSRKCALATQIQTRKTQRGYSSSVLHCSTKKANFQSGLSRVVRPPPCVRAVWPTSAACDPRVLAQYPSASVAA